MNIVILVQLAIVGTWVPLAVRQLLDDGPRLASIAARAKQAGHPQAAHDIAAAFAQSRRS